MSSPRLIRSWRSWCAPCWLLLACLGCSSFPLAPTPPLGPARVSTEPASTPPDWYLTPPSDTPAALYGVGAANRLPSAKTAALVDVAGKLAISVRSRQLDRMILHDDQLSQHVESELEARVRDREFHDYEVVENAMSGDTFYTLVRVDRQRLVADTRSRLHELDRDIASRLEAAAPVSPIAYELAYSDVRPALVRAAASLKLLSALDPGFDASPYLARFRAYRTRYDQTRDEVVFALLPAPESIAVAEMVQELFAGEGLQSEVVAPEEAATRPCEGVCVEVATEWNRRFAAKRYITTLISTFRVRDASGNVSAARSHQVRATALSGYAEANQAATERLREALTRDGILTGIGLTPSTPKGLRL